MLLRRRGPATVALVIMLIMTFELVNTDSRLAGLAYNAANFPIGVFLLVRFGLLATVTHLVLYSLLTTVALRFGADVPWATTSYLLVGIVVALALYSYHTALGGRSVFSAASPGEGEE